VTAVAVTTAVRHVGRTSFSGYVRILDLDSGETVHCEPVPESPWRSVDPNPRGGTRGAKGMSAHGERLVICNSDSVFVLDSRLREVAAFSHPLAGAIHDVLAEEDGIWVTCSNADLLIKLDWQGRLDATWSWREDSSLVRALGFRSLPPTDLTLDYRDPRVLQGGVHNIVHLNGVTRSPEGLLLSFGRVLSRREVGRRSLKARLGGPVGRLGLVRRPPPKSEATPAGAVTGSSFAIVLLHAGDGLQRGAAELLLREDGIAVPNHNVLAAGGLIVYNDTNRGRLVAFERDTGRERVAVPVPGDPSFVRGLARLDNGVVLVGSQRPLAVHAIDLNQGELVASYELDGAPNESVYAVCPLPAGFAGGPGIGSLFTDSAARESEGVPG
jgi:hypothetical protein